MRKAHRRFIRFLQLQVAQPVRLIKEKTQHLRQHHIVDIGNVQYQLGADGRGQQRAQRRQQSFGQAILPEGIRQQSEPGKRGAAKAGVSDAGRLAHFRDKRRFGQMRTGGGRNQMALRSRFRKRGDKLIRNHHDSSIGARIRAA